MIGSGIALAVVTCAAATLADSDAATHVYRIEKQVVVHAWKQGETRLAAEASFVGVCAVRSTPSGRTVEEYLTGGMLSDLGEELPPRPAGQPLHWKFTLNDAGDAAAPVRGRGGLAVWTLPFELYLLPRENMAQLRAARHGVREFTASAAKPAGSGIWSWRVGKDEGDVCELAGPCSGKFEGGFSLAGSLGRAIDPQSGTIRWATATLAISLPVSARLAALSDAPERQAEEAKFFQGFESIMVHESARLALDDTPAAQQIELPASLANPLEKLSAAAQAK